MIKIKHFSDHIVFKGNKQEIVSLRAEFETRKLQLG